jgi:simple sugar transport system permease protein
MGAWAAAGIGIHWGSPDGLVLVVMAVAGAAAGAAWILVPALARAYWGVNEIITTLLLNFVALQIVTWASLGFWRDAQGAVVQSTPRVQAELPTIPGLDDVHIGFLVPLLIAVGMMWIFRGTKFGYEVDMIGGNPRAAAFAGINVPVRIVVVMLCTGAIAGLAGMLHLSGEAGRLNSGISTNYGLSGFIVAALAGGSIVGLIVGGVFIASMLHAGTALQTKGLSIHIIVAIYGAVLLGLAIGEVAARFRLVREESPLGAEPSLGAGPSRGDRTLGTEPAG